MARDVGACLVCGRPIVYYESARKMECVMCHGVFDSHAGCEDGHYVCDECHAKRGIQVIMEGCKKSMERNPIAIMQELMEDPYIYMHGPEHHVMVGAALLTAYKNCGGFEGGASVRKGKLAGKGPDTLEREPAGKEQDILEQEREPDREETGESARIQEAFYKALEEMKARGSEYPGGACGLWGCCGAAVSTGIFMSIITKATPLTGNSWRLSNQMTSRALGAVAALGGPRCCKRDSFTAAKEAVEFVREELGVKMELPQKIECGFSSENQQCLKKHCPYYKAMQDTEAL